MLNRNDRISLRRNRSAVSWLILLIIILTVWLVTSIRNESTQSEDYSILLIEMSDMQTLNERKSKMIDSLVKVINYKPIDTPVVIKPYRTPVKKDTSSVHQKADSSKSVNKTIILNDSLK